VYTGHVSEQIPKTFRDWREARRFRVWQLRQKGWKHADIAEALGVTPAAVSQWVKRAREGGVRALRMRSGSGARPGLTAAQLERLPELLSAGPEAYGFRGDVWTRGRVGAVIKKEYGVSYSDGHVGRLLRRVGWSLQKPEERADQRDEEAVERWQEETWPALKKKAPEKSEPLSS
jgi:transposase